MKRIDGLVLTVVAVAFVAAKLAIVNVPAYWDETRWVGQAFQLANWPLVSVFPGFRPMEAFAGHPPGIHLVFALAAKIGGSSMRTAHLVTIAFGALGLCFTYLVGTRLFDRWTATVATLLLFICPAYFAQSGMFLADVPVAALSTGCVYFLLTRRTAAYVLCATAMVLIKETSAAIVLAMLAFDVFFAGHERASRIRAAGRHLVPLAALGVFVTWQKIVTGAWWLIYADPFDTSWLKTTVWESAHQAWLVTRWIFVDQWRWMLAVPLLLLVIVNAAARRRRELWLFALIMVCASYPFAFAGGLFLPRYLMPVLPLFLLASVWAMREWLPSWRTRTLAALGVIGVMAWSLAARPFSGTAELNMRYLDVVHVHEEMAHAIERDFSSARILTAWPHTGELAIPQFGFVRSPIANDDAEHVADLDRALTHVDLVWVTAMPTTPDLMSLRDRTIAAGWRVVRTVSRGPVVSELFAPPR